MLVLQRWSRWRSVRAASDNISHGTWILVAAAVAVLLVGLMAVPGTPVHRWVQTTMQSPACIAGTGMLCTPRSEVLTAAVFWSGNLTTRPLITGNGVWTTGQWLAAIPTSGGRSMEAGEAPATAVAAVPLSTPLSARSTITVAWNSQQNSSLSLSVSVNDATWLAVASAPNIGTTNTPTAPHTYTLPTAVTGTRQLDLRFQETATPTTYAYSALASVALETGGQTVSVPLWNGRNGAATTG